MLVDIHKYHPNPALEVFSLVCSSLSIIGLVVTLIVFKALKSSQMKVDNDRNLIGINCCVCLLASHVIIAVAMDKKFFYISDVSSLKEFLELKVYFFLVKGKMMTIAVVTPVCNVPFKLTQMFFVSPLAVVRF